MEETAIRQSDWLAAGTRYYCQRYTGADPGGGEMGEFSPPPPFSEPPSFFFFLIPQTPQPGFGSITLLQKFTPHFKILDPRLVEGPISTSQGTKAGQELGLFCNAATSLL